MALKLINGEYITIDDVEIAEIEKAAYENEKKYWVTVSYNKAVEQEIAKKYSIGEELAIQRQKEEKPEEYAEYYQYCEDCKLYVKHKMEVYGRGSSEI